MDQGDIRRHPQRPGGVPARPVQHHHRMHVGGKLAAESLQERIHHLRIDLRSDQARGRAGLGAYGGKDIQVIVLVLLDRPWTRADFGPDAGDRAMLPEACFILVVDQEPFVRVGFLDLCQRFGEFRFLKDSITSGSVSGCVVLGIRSL